MIKVEAHGSLYKDPNTNTFVNRDVTAIEAARKRKLARKLREEKDQELNDKVDRLSDDVNRLTKMFEQLLEKENGTS